MLTTSVNEKQHSLLEELVEQINAVYNALEISRQQYDLYQNKKKEMQRPQPQASKSSWGSGSNSSPSQVYQETAMCVLPPDQHPIVLGIWATSSSDTGYRAALGRVLQELLLEKRRHMAQLELAKVASSD